MIGLIETREIAFVDHRALRQTEVGRFTSARRDGYVLQPPTIELGQVDET